MDEVPYNSDISAINSQGIESMTVLKDASLITTKAGKSSSAKVSFDAKWGSNSRMVPQYDVIGSAEYYETQYKALYNSKTYARSSAAEVYTYADNTLLDSKNGGLGIGSLPAANITIITILTLTLLLVMQSFITR